MGTEETAHTIERIAALAGLAPRVTYCGWCDQPLDTPKDRDAGYHTLQDNAFSCYDRIREMN